MHSIFSCIVVYSNTPMSFPIDTKSVCYYAIKLLLMFYIYTSDKTFQMRHDEYKYGNKSDASKLDIRYCNIAYCCIKIINHRFNKITVCCLDVHHNILFVLRPCEIIPPIWTQVVKEIESFAPHHCRFTSLQGHWRKQSGYQRSVVLLRCLILPGIIYEGHLR
jgi:hypothetical protein